MKPEKEIHAEISPSGAHRWMTCAGSVSLCRGEPDTDSEYAKEGTFAHALAAYCLGTGRSTKEADEFAVPASMHEPVQEYIDYVRARVEDGDLLVEQALNLEPFTKEKKAKGTADAVIISKNGKKLKIIDLKYGMGQRVDAEDNPQLLLYALAGHLQFGLVCEPDEIFVAIHQPRVDHVDEATYTVPELIAFRKKVDAAVQRIAEAEKANDLTPYLNPDKKACQWCKAAHKCPALANLVARETGVDFQDVTENLLVDPVDPHLAMTKVPLIEVWAKAVRAKVEADLFSGNGSKFWKLVEGKKGNRSWRDDGEVIKRAGELYLKDDDIYTHAILTPAKMEKKLKKNAYAWEQLSEFIQQKHGQPSVAPIDDPRPAYQPNPGEDFERIE